MTCLHNENQAKEMRTKLTCDICNYKTTSETVLRQQKQLNHEKKINIKNSKCKSLGKQEKLYLRKMKYNSKQRVKT